VIVINIKDLTLTEVTSKIAPYLKDYFAGREISGLDDNLFQESYTLGFEEVSHLIPDEYKSRFNDGDMFMGSSGCVYFLHEGDSPEDIEYFVMLLSTEDMSQALFLHVQEVNPVTTEAAKDILLADFMKG
jgi:hypothetical protein